ncbi:MAG: lysylphosphatidylglycerol synthase transmembrane domain-containing protein [Dehalococcoidia bacterium]|nr:lysylphosphatidylglycerol synthase transmembrane domain-containing protein [Dehalococcoidia bacterium]
MVKKDNKDRGLTKFILGALVSVGLIFAVARYVNLSQAARLFDDFRWGYLPLVLSSILIYYLLKGLRWHFFLREVGIILPLQVSLLVYLAGQWFAFSPAGEFVKVYLLRRYGVDFGQASVTVVMQVMVDFLCLAFLGSLSLIWYPALGYIVLPFSALLFLGVGVLHQEWLWERLERWQRPSGILRRLGLSWEGLLHNTCLLTRGKPILIGFALGLPTTFLGSLSLFIVAVGYAAPVDLAQSTFVYSLSQLLGAMSMLPHGLGAVEGSSLALFGHVGLSNAAQAVVIIALFRLASLVWGIGIGGLALLSLPLLAPRKAYSVTEHSA